MSELNQNYDAILLCGGLGTRLTDINDSLPKSLVRVGDKELIRYSTDTLDSEFVSRMIFAIGYKGRLIQEWAAQAVTQHEVVFSESTEKGILPAVTAAAQKVREKRMIVCNTDEVRTGLDITDAISAHETTGNLATMVVTRANKLYRHRVVVTNSKRDQIIRTELKPERHRDHPLATGLVNTGFLILEEGALDHFDPSHSKDWSGIIDPLCDAGQLGAYVNPDITYFNVGTKEEHDEATMSLEQYAGQR